MPQFVLAFRPIPATLPLASITTVYLARSDTKRSGSSASELTDKLGLLLSSCSLVPQAGGQQQHCSVAYNLTYSLILLAGPYQQVQQDGPKQTRASPRSSERSWPSESRQQHTACGCPERESASDAKVCAVSRYQFYTTFTMWPPEVRGDLRAGIKAKHQGDLDLSVRYLHRCVSKRCTPCGLPLRTSQCMADRAESANYCVCLRTSPQALRCCCGPGGSARGHKPPTRGV